MKLIYSIIKAQNDARKNGYEGLFSCTLTAERYRQFIEETRELCLFNVDPQYIEARYTAQIFPGKFYVGKICDVLIYVEQSQVLKENLILEAYENQLKQ